MFIWKKYNLRVSETIKSKLKSEIYEFNVGVVIQAYHADNIVFTVGKLMSQLIESNQKLS